jgi:hypothetical protein
MFPLTRDDETGLLERVDDIEMIYSR